MPEQRGEKAPPLPPPVFHPHREPYPPPSPTRPPPPPSPRPPSTSLTLLTRMSSLPSSDTTFSTAEWQNCGVGARAGRDEWQIARLTGARLAAAGWGVQ
jgi:hypothetical protein